MGITAHSIQLIEKALVHNPSIKSVIELGSQNLYTGNEVDPPFASTWYKARGIKYESIDMAGDNGAMRLDLSKPISLKKSFDLVTDFGTSEHVVRMQDYESVEFHSGYINSIYPKGEVKISDIETGFYNCMKNKHNLLAKGGICVSENPLTGSWPGHGYSYYTEEFYTELCRLMGYQLLEVGKDAAMGNTKDGWNVYCLYKKVTNSEFLSEAEFYDVKKFIFTK
jgi:hypothetical protein